MHCIAKQHGFIIANLVQQIFVPLDKVGLLVGIQLARLSACDAPCPADAAGHANLGG
jgi:hypothetical protein